MDYFKMGVHPKVGDFAINLTEIDRLAEFLANTLKDAIRAEADEFARKIVQQTWRNT
jgi:hypothetical protein